MPSSRTHLCFFSLVALASLATHSLGFQVTVDVEAKECFHEQLAQHDKLAILYDVVDGGFRDITFSVIGPDLETMYDDRHSTGTATSSTGRFTFSAFQAGQYQWCFVNSKNNSASPKEIKFQVEVQANSLDSANFLSPTDDAELDNTVALYLKELKARLKYAKYEAEYAAFAVVNHHQLSEQVNAFVTGWEMFELLLTLGLIVGQIFYLRKLFETRLHV